METIVNLSNSQNNNSHSSRCGALNSLHYDHSGGWGHAAVLWRMVRILGIGHSAGSVHGAKVIKGYHLQDNFRLPGLSDRASAIRNVSYTVISQSPIGHSI